MSGVRSILRISSSILRTKQASFKVDLGLIYSTNAAGKLSVGRQRRSPATFTTFGLNPPIGNASYMQTDDGGLWPQ